MCVCVWEKGKSEVSGGKLRTKLRACRTILNLGKKRENYSLAAEDRSKFWRKTFEFLSFSVFPSKFIVTSSILRFLFLFYTPSQKVSKKNWKGAWIGGRRGPSWSVDRHAISLMDARRENQGHRTKNRRARGTGRISTRMWSCRWGGRMQGWAPAAMSVPN